MLTEANGLLYMRARYYSPDMMRFINEDIVTGDISNSNSLNRYSYVEGNPVTMVDPFGLEPKDAQKMDIFDRISEGFIGLMNAGKGVCMGMEGGAAIGTGIILVLSGPAGWIMGGVMIVGGAYVAICGLADGIEGGHQIVEAVTGTPQDTSNFVRDKVFAWDPDVYYISEALATCGVSELIRSAKGFLPSSGGITTQINGEGSLNSEYYQDATGKWHRPNGEFASNAEMGLPNSSEHYLNRPYIRQDTIDAVNANTKVNYETGQIYDSISRKWVDPSNVELGHKTGREFAFYRDMAESQGWTQAQFNDFMNNPDFYAWQDIHCNRSHVFEAQH